MNKVVPIVKIIEYSSLDPGKNSTKLVHRFTGHLVERTWEVINRSRYKHPQHNMQQNENKRPLNCLINQRLSIDTVEQTTK